MATSDRPTWLPKPGAIGLSPMVGVTTLGFRLFAARHGAEFVFTEELVALKLVKCKREVRPAPALLLHLTGLPVGTALVEYVYYEAKPQRDEPMQAADNGALLQVPAVQAPKKRRTVVFATLSVPEEHRAAFPFPEGAPVIAQLGVGDPGAAAVAAAMIARDVNGIDVNMCCPQRFSVSTKMGITLMTDTPRAVAILRAVRNAVGPLLPLSLKTRLFESVEDSVAQISACLSSPEASVGTVTIHARFRTQRSVVSPKVDLAQQLLAQLRERFPQAKFVFNGALGCTGLDGGGSIGGGPGVAALRAAVCEGDSLSFDGGAVARDAMWNPTLFSEAAYGSGALSDLPAVHAALLEWQLACGTPFAWLKYHLTRVFGLRAVQKACPPALHEALTRAASVCDLCAALNMDPVVAVPALQAHESLVGADDCDETHEALT